jgi:tRNA U38,U39,U40 pseudouridine synthase TruA
MITIDVSDPTLYGDIEWISVKIHGQSFMLHQIVSSLTIFNITNSQTDIQRKMMSLAMLACRTNTPPSLIAETYGKLHRLYLLQSTKLMIRPQKNPYPQSTPSRLTSRITPI